MANFVTGRTKRKGFDEVYDDFSYLSLSAPAAKTRRLDAELLSLAELPERVGWPVFEHQHIEGFAGDVMADAPQLNMTDILPPTENEERALVLYKPLHPHYSPSLQMDPELISGLKNPAFWSGNQNLLDDFVEEHQPSSANSLAVVPWVPAVSRPNLQASTSISGNVEEDAMEAIEGSESMEVEEECGQFVNTGVGTEGFHQWQQQCMIPELSHITSAPVLGSW